MEIKKGLFLIIVGLLLINQVNSGSNPIELDAVSTKIDVYQGEEFEIKVFMPSFSKMEKIDEMKILIYSDHSLSLTSSGFFNGIKDTGRDTLGAALIAEKKHLDIINQETYPVTNLDIGLRHPTVKYATAPPVSLYFKVKTDKELEEYLEALEQENRIEGLNKGISADTIPSKLNSGDHEITIFAVYRIGQEWFQSKDSVNIHINSWFEEYQNWTIFLAILAIITSICLKFWKYLKTIIWGLIFIYKFIFRKVKERIDNLREIFKKWK